MQQGITGFVRIPNSINPDRVYAIGKGGRPIENEQDLMKATGASSVAEAWRIANVQSKSPDEALSIGITSDEAKAKPSGSGTPAEENTLQNPGGIDPQVWNALDPNNKAMAIYDAETKKKNNEEYIKNSTAAMDLAKQQADPYWAEKINILKDELSRFLSGGQEDLVAKENDLTRRRAEIENNLKYNKEYLSAEQQAELARQASKYSDDLDTTRQLMADRGLSSSSIKNQAEEKLNEANQDIITSTARKYAYQTGSAERTASSNVADIVSQIEEAKRMAQQNATSATRKTEATIGSSEIGNIPGAGQYGIGGISIGNIGEQKAENIYSRAQRLMMQNYPSL